MNHDFVALAAAALLLVQGSTPAPAGPQHKQPLGGGPIVETPEARNVPKGALYGLSTVQLDFDGDGKRDVAVGAPGEGAVYVLFGPEHTRVQRITPLQEQAADRFGDALAAGQVVTGEGDELVIGAPRRSVGTAEGAGTVWLVGHGDEAPALLDFPVEAGAALGTAVAVGDFDADGKLEVAAGAPLATVNGVKAGVVRLLEPGGPTTSVQNPVEHPFGNYGHDLASGDADGDGKTDLFVSALGNPSADGVASGGQVYVLLAPIPGGATQVVEDPTRSAADKIVRFGMSIHAADQDGDGKADLAVGAPRKDVDGVVDAGAAFLFHAPDFAAGDARRFTRSGTNGSELLGFRVRIANATGGVEAEVVAVALQQRPGLVLWDGDDLDAEPLYRPRPADGSHHYGQGLSVGRPATSGAQVLILGDPNFGRARGRVQLLHLDRPGAIEASTPKEPRPAQPADH